MSIDPIQLSVFTRAAPARAFELFTGQMGRWWPKGMTVASRPHAAIVIEPSVGGRWFERDEEGAETPWGVVRVWEPPSRLVLVWRLSAEHRYDPSLSTEVEIGFRQEAGGTRVTLEHRDLEKFGSEALLQRSRLSGGWPRMLEEFQKLADAAAPVV